MTNDKPELESSEQLLWLKNEIIPKIVQSLDKDVGKMRYEIEVPSGNFFVAGIYMTKLIFSSDDGLESDTIGVVIKVQPEDESARAFTSSDIFFHNEIIFYRYFGKNYNDYPKCFLTLSEPIAKASIVLENVTQFGYKTVPFKQDIGMKRALAAVREIGKFHARGYVLKENNPEDFFAIVEKIRSPHDRSAHPAKIKLFNEHLLRTVNYLRSVNYDSEFCDKMLDFFSNGHRKILVEIAKPRNELAVLCHGDFTANNVLFKEEDNGEFKAMLIDFATFCYSSPAIDVSAFVYVSCEPAVRKNFNVIFKAYHDMILEYLKEHGIQNLEKYSFDAFFEDFKRHAIHGCATGFFFLPVLYSDHPLHFGSLINDAIAEAEYFMVNGGNGILKMLADMLLELREMGALDHIIHQNSDQ